MNRFQDWTPEDLLALDRATEALRRELGEITAKISGTFLSVSAGIYAQQAAENGGGWINTIIPLRWRYDDICREIRAIADRIRPAPPEEAAA